MPLLPNINSPQDLKNLSIDQLPLLAKEIRERIIEVMSINGGHLASNLGSIEFTIALHYVFNSPTDKLVFDVSHQTYTHKILTGRNAQFDTIRQYKGLCGFAHPKESAHDHFQAGHAGTALSLSLGLTKTRDLDQGNAYIIPIIGDATLTCGTALEALNNMSRDLQRFIVILNDNNMSISNNVGAITKILSRLINSPTASKIHQELEKLVNKIPNYGQSIAQKGRKVAESLKNLVSQGLFFEQYGLNYIGPVDGHDIAGLIALFEKIRDSEWPVVIHLNTNKGHGMDVAINNPITYHGVRPFNLETGKFLPLKSSQPTFPSIFGRHLLAMGKTDPSIVVVTPAMSKGSCLDDFMETFPSRSFDVGIAESHAVTFAGGLSYGGKKTVFVSIYATFLQRAFDNLFHDVCLQELPVIFAIDRAGISGPDGSTHHGIYDISFLNAMPNMVITQPRDGHLLKELMESAPSYKRPVAIRYPNMTTDEYDQPLQARQIGRGEILAPGKDVLIIALGHLCKTALIVRQNLNELGIQATVMDPIFLKPLDGDLLCDLLLTHQKVVTLEEHSVQCGLGSIINHFLMKNGYSNVTVLNMGIPETFVEHGSHQELMDAMGLTAPKITETIHKWLSFNLTHRELEKIK